MSAKPASKWPGERPHAGAFPRPALGTGGLIDVAIKFAFDILAFTSVMVLIVLGLGVIASMMGIFNFAHGELVVLGAYTVYLRYYGANTPKAHS